MKYFILAGEASGDNLGALLIEEINNLDGAAEFSFFGGDAMQKASGLSPKRHIRELAFMGFVEVAANLRKILSLMKQAKREIAAFHPDVLVCIDYPGFNLRLASWAKKQGIRVDFYVAPQIWAWRQSRVHRIAKVTDRILAILPFEPAFYAKHGYEVSYVGHPLPHKIDTYEIPQPLVFKTAHGPVEPSTQILAILPGSRQQEISRLLPVMLEAAEALRLQFPALQLVIAAAPVISLEELSRLSSKHEVAWCRDSYALLSKATLACVASGTATLETALFGVPEVVCYQGGAISVALARKLIKVPYISLVNLILSSAIVPELIQQTCTAERITIELKDLLSGSKRNDQLEGFKQLRAALEPYNATQQAARWIVEDAKNKA